MRDGHVAVGGQGDQREDGHANRGVFGELGQLADDGAERPRLERVDGGREGHRHEQNEQIADGQIEDERVGHAAHRLLAAEDPDQAAVSQHADHEDDDEDDGHDVRLGPRVVRLVAQARVVRRVQHWRRRVSALVQHDDYDCDAVLSLMLPRSIHFCAKLLS